MRFDAEGDSFQCIPDDAQFRQAASSLAPERRGTAGVNREPLQYPRGQNYPQNTGKRCRRSLRSRTGLVLTVAASYVPSTTIPPAKVPNSVLFGTAESMYGVKLISPAWVSVGTGIACLLPGVGLVTAKDFSGRINLSRLIYIAGILRLGALVADDDLSSAGRQCQRPAGAKCLALAAVTILVLLRLD